MSDVASVRAASGGSSRSYVAATLSAGAHRPGVNDPGRQTEAAANLVVSGPLGGGNNGIGRRSEDDPNLVLSHALRAQGQLAHREDVDTYVVADTLTAPDTNAKPINGKRQDGSRSDKSPLVLTHALTSMAVRRLTPVECERLQGFPDGWTCLCQPLEAYADDPESAAERCTCPDSPRYRQMGNAVTVSVVEWIGHRLLIQSRRLRKMERANV
jgi:site-specific DNA-cytosine methylase